MIIFLSVLRCAGTRVLIVDQWIETGGTMEAAATLLEGQGGIVAGKEYL